jgi:hypothetical protein
MSDNPLTPKKPQAKYEPGELEKTRQRLGKLDREESLRIAQLLGGEIGIEKSPEINTKDIRPLQGYTNRTRRRTSKKETQVERNWKKTAPTPAKSIEEARKPQLPHINTKEENLIDKLMYSVEYRIKSPPPLFVRIITLGKTSSNKILPEFIEISLKKHLAHIQNFIFNVNQLISAAPDSYRTKIEKDGSYHFQTLNVISEWEFKPLNQLYEQLLNLGSDVSVRDLIPFVTEFYKTAMRLFFLGETQMTVVIKNTYATISEQKKESAETLLRYAKVASSEWMYIYGQVIKGLYPLLMRMCSSDFQPYPDFFRTRITKILKFLDLTKYDIILPQKKIDEQNAAEKDNVDNKDKIKIESLPSQDNAKPEEPAYGITEQIKKSLEILNRFFPDAGWLEIENKPDLFPYFQPLYQFKDGFNLLAPSNPLQITLVLHRIIEDFFQGCRNIIFDIQGDPELPNESDTIQDIFNDWSLYREVIFERQLCGELKEFVNHLYTQSDFRKTQYGKRKLSNWLWQVKNYFLPNLSFELVFMEKQEKDTTYKSYPQRITFLKNVFSTIIKRVEASGLKSEGNDALANSLGAQNLWSRYRFDVPNPISHRLDILLGGKKSKNITNLNLMKYTLCVINILDWWVNNPNSPAYSESIAVPYRAAEDTGTPYFAVTVRNDQNDLFINAVKEVVHKINHKK